MSSFKILTRRIPLLDQSYKVKKYTGELSYNVKGIMGFKKAQSYWETSDNYLHNNSLITISEWESSDSWERWINSKNRMKIYDKYKQYLKNENHVVLCHIKYRCPLL